MATTTEKPKNEAPAPDAHVPTVSENFVARVERQFVAEMGSAICWTAHQKMLAQHLYVKINASLQALEVKRLSNSYKKDDPPIAWPNVNMIKLAMDAVSRVSLGLDASLPNHIHIVPYLNKRTGQYDVDLRIGYVGRDHCARHFALDRPLDILYQLVHESDKFKYGTQTGIPYYDFEQTDPFNPGRVIGGFGFISYEDPRKNRLVIVEYREFEKARKASGGVEFWGGEQTGWENGKKVNKGYDEKFEKEMQFKTVVIRTCSKIALDPKKISAESLSAISDAELDSIEAEVAEDAAANANQKLLAIPSKAESVTEIPEMGNGHVGEPVTVAANDDGPDY